MKRIRLIHWNAGEAAARADRLEKLSYEVDAEPLSGPDGLREMKADPPDACLIDLSRLPSHGRDVALALRATKATRSVPLVFVEGDKEKVEKVQSLLPDATYTTWTKIGPALRRAMKSAPKQPVVPASNLAGYSGTPLVKKLGIKPGMTVTLVNSPGNFVETLGELPADVTLRKQARGRCDLAIWFVTECRQLETRIDKITSLSRNGTMWIAWPKRASGVATDVTQNHVRRIGLASGLVDFKICAIDATWSGLKFTRRRK